jgi:hypothetical protein
MALAQALAREFDAVGVVNDAVEDGVGESGDPDQRRIPPLSMDWCPKYGLCLGAMGCLAKSFR